MVVFYVDIECGGFLFWMISTWGCCCRYRPEQGLLSSISKFMKFVAVDIGNNKCYQSPPKKQNQGARRPQVKGPQAPAPWFCFFGGLWCSIIRGKCKGCEAPQFVTSRFKSVGNLELNVKFNKMLVFFSIFKFSAKKI